MREVLPGRLWIGNARDARDVRGALSCGITAVVELAMEEPPNLYPRDIIYCRIPLLDGPDNPVERLRLAIDVIVNLVSAGTPTLVACSGGMSRSPAIAAAALSRLEGIELDACILRLAQSGPCDLSPGLWRDVKIACQP